MTLRGWAAPAAVAAALRLLAVLASAREVADVRRYRRVATHLLDVSWNPYLTHRLYPYPPVWMWWEAASEWLARQGVLPFAVAVKLPVVAADVVIVVLLARLTAGATGPARHAPWLWALHPVSLLVTGFHGQFDALALGCVLGAVLLLQRGRADASALALGLGVALKSFPVLLVPVLALERPALRERLRYAALAGLPVAALLAPFLLHDARAVTRELFAYGGVADFGWIGAWRGVRWIVTDRLALAQSRQFALAVAFSKWLFLAVATALVVARARRRLGGDASRVCLLVLLAFIALYGALSAQYLLWVVPLALLAPGRWLGAYTAVATAALAGFYLYLAPGVLVRPKYAQFGEAPGQVWVAGTVVLCLVSLAWLVAETRKAATLEPRPPAP